MKLKTENKNRKKLRGQSSTVKHEITDCECIYMCNSHLPFMKVIILAAGIGSRIKCITKDIPKCMISINGEPIIERQIRLLKKHGFKSSDIVVACGYKHEMLSHLDVCKVVNLDYECTDNSYTLGISLSDIDDDVLVMDGDLVYDENILNSVLSCRDTNVIFTKQSSDESDSTGIILEKDRVISIGKKIKNSGFVYLSIFKVSRQNLPLFKEKLLQKSNKNTWYTSALEELMGVVTFKNVVLNGLWHEIDDMNDLLEASNMFL